MRQIDNCEKIQLNAIRSSGFSTAQHANALHGRKHPTNKTVITDKVWFVLFRLFINLHFFALSSGFYMRIE